MKLPVVSRDLRLTPTLLDWCTEFYGEAWDLCPVILALSSRAPIQDVIISYRKTNKETLLCKIRVERAM